MTTDWLGQPYGPGDLVLYPAGSGRSITMVIGEVLKVNKSGSVSIRPIRSSRWKQHYGRSKYIDERTGKTILNPYGAEHIESPGHYRNKTTGDEISSDHYYDLRRRDVVAALSGYEYVPTVFKDYVKFVVEPTKSVTVSVTENITKWTGELPEEAGD